MFLIVDFKPEDILHIDIRPEQYDILDAVDNLQEYGVLLANTYNPKTVIYNHKILMIAGIAPLNKHVGEGYFILSKDFENDFKTIGITLSKEIRRYIDQTDFVRVQCTCRKDYPKAQRFVEFFGFKNESVMEKASTNGTDLIMYKRIKN